MKMDESIVISGIAGKFPDASNVQEFSEKLFNKVYLVSESAKRFSVEFSDYPKYAGLIDNLDKFDSALHRSSMSLIRVCDPQIRLLAETVHEAIFDSGYSPEEFKNSNTGVYVGCTNYDSFNYWQSQDTFVGMAAIGNAPYAMSNRISFVMDFKGPSMTIDTACSSSFYALSAAVEDIKSGKCDSAIVAGSNLILSPIGMNEGVKSGVLTRDGLSQPFDKNASGFVRSEAICVVFLQKTSQARRNYASILNIKTANDGYKIIGATVPSKSDAVRLLEKTYQEANISPFDINFIESHATSTRVGDKVQVDSFDAAFCNNRSCPLKIGSVKSNTGHTESASGLVSLVKSILMFENEKIIPNINITELRDDCDAFTSGRIQVPTEVEPFHDDIIGIDNFGILGAISHCIIKRNTNTKITKKSQHNLPRLMLWAGRTHESVNFVFDNLLQTPFDDEYLTLLQKTQRITQPTSKHRGFAIFDVNKADQNIKCLERNVIESDAGDKKPIVFVYSGVGSQWLGMGRDLMKIPIIKETIDECHKVLESTNVNLLDILTSDKPETFNNCLNVFVGVVAIQIALTKILKNIGIIPDYFVGHSVGELACAYADETLTLEQTMLVAYVRGKVAMEKCVKTGGMAAVAMDYDSLNKTLPDNIEIACHNSKDSFTISGDFVKVENFVNQSKKSGYLAKVIDSCGIAFHSSQMIECGDVMAEMLKNIICEPNKRSEKWISTSSTTRHEFEIISEFSDAEYFKTNLLNPVRFSDAIDELPENSFIIEIAPHSIMQGILMKNAPTSRTVVGLTQRGSPDGSTHLLKCLGKIFQNGIDMDISEIYPPVQFPVSRGTRMIAPLIKWDHSESHFVPNFDASTRFSRRQLIINLYMPEYAHYSGHIIDGQILLPASGYIELVWETFAMMHGRDYQHFSVQLDNIKFIRAVILSPKTECNLTICIQKGSGEFEISENDEVVVSGQITKISNGTLSKIKIEPINSSEFTINNQDFYKKILKLRGYEYLENFKLVRKIGGFSSGKLRGQIEWRSEWTSFMDSMLHFYMADFKNRGLRLPTSIAKVIIDTETHWKKLNHDKHHEIEKIDEKVYMKAEFNVTRDIYLCGGIQLSNIRFEAIGRRKQMSRVSTETFKFIPHFPTPELSLHDATKFCAQLFIENMGSFDQVIVEVSNGLDIILNDFASEHCDWEFASHKFYIVTESKSDEFFSFERDGVKVIQNISDITSKANLIVVQSNSKDVHLSSKLFMEYAGKVKDNGMIIWRTIAKTENKLFQTNSIESVNMVAQVRLIGEIWNVYFKRVIKSEIIPLHNNYFISSDTRNFDWIDKLQKNIHQTRFIYARSDGKHLSGINSFYKSVLKDYELKTCQCLFINDDSAPDFNTDDPFYANQMNLKMAMNVYQNGSWGSYKHLQLPDQVKLESPADHCFVNVKSLGDLSSIQWFTGNLDITQADIVKVHYGSLNFKDLLIATKRISQDENSKLVNQYNCGLEFSGVDKMGRKVMGIVKSKSLSNYIKPAKDLTFVANDKWSLEDAATIPLVYTTVYLAFFIHADIQPGQTILIHSATGGLGQAAIRTALNYGLRVFATVGSDEKKKVLLDLFPQLCNEHIGSSADTSFEDMVMNETDGVGVNYVLNSLTGEKLEASIRCVAKNGTFLEVGRFDMENGTNLNMKHFIKQINFKTVYLSQENIQEMNEERRSYLMNKIQTDISSGRVQPLTRTVFDACDAQKAFRYLSSGKHIGKVLIKVRNDDESTLPVEVHHRVHFNSEKSYIVTGGLGGVGIEMCDWMILRDCRKLVLSSRRGISSSYQEYKIRLWKTYGVQIEISTADITTKSGCDELIATATSLGPVGGIFSLAAILDNEYFEHMTPQKFGSVFPSKVHSVQFLDEISRQSCHQLDHFVVFSSVASGRGSVTQSNYAMANSITEKIVEQRRNEGFPGKAIQWGPIGGAGMLEDYDKKNLHVFELQSISSCIDLMDNFLSSDECVCSSLQFSLNRKRNGEIADEENSFEKFLKFLGINGKSVDENSMLSDLGVDSMIGTEIQHILSRDYGIKFSLNEVRSKKLHECREIIAKKEN